MGIPYTATGRDTAGSRGYVHHHAGSSIPTERGHVAVLFLVINTQVSPPKVLGVEITQANPTRIGAERAYAEVARAEGPTWEEAERALRDWLEQPYNTWIKPLLLLRDR